MSRRLVLLALVLAALVPAAARADVPVALYPLRVPGLSPDQRADLHALLKAGLLSGMRRGVLRPRTPLILAAMCTEPLAPACVARLADDGLLLVGRGERKGGTVLITAALYDRNGARTHEVRFIVDLVIENLRPVNDALAMLESEIDGDGTVAGAPKVAPVAEARAPKPPIVIAPRPVSPAPVAAAPLAAAPRAAAPLAAAPRAAAPLAAAPRAAASAPAAAPPKVAAPTPRSLLTLPAIPLPPPPVLRPSKPATSKSTATATATAPRAPTTTATPTPPPQPAKAPAAASAPAKVALAPIDVSAPAEPPPLWRRQAGPFFTIVGGALLASGAAVAVANRSLAHDLDAKRAAGTLSAADRSSFDKVDRYNVLSTVLLAGGGLSAVAGTWIWFTAPARPGDPALAGAGGRF